MKLRRIGHEVAGYTARGEDAVSLAISTNADLVLMDIRLDGVLDGVEAAHQIRDRLRLPVVFLTAYADDETVRRASMTEAFGYLLKPFDDSQLRTVVEMGLYKHAAERKLRESERRYATTLASIGDAVVAADDKAVVTFMNPSAERLIGWSHLDAVGRPINEVIDLVCDLLEWPELGGALHPPAGFSDRHVLITRDGRRVSVDACGSQIIGDAGEVTGMVYVFRDMTERAVFEEKLRKAQHELAHVGRVSTIGQLTVSIAHEINQPLMSVTTNAATCLAWLSPDRLNLPEAREAAERVIQNGHRAGEVVASIRALARKTELTITEVDLNDVVMEALLFLQGEWRRLGIATDIQLSTDALGVRGDRVQLQQLALNLLMNGIDAVSDVDQSLRKLAITTRVEAGGWATVTVSDTGSGIDLSTESRIFDAFVTTKANGVGMGLSICRSIVETHGGRIWFTRNPDVGTSFHFTFPSDVSIANEH